MKFTPVQMIGTQRSGSNLLRLMLNQLPEVSAPHPPHILERFMPLLPIYGDLLIPANFRALAADVCRLINYNPVPWHGACLNPGDLVERCQQPTLTEMTSVIYTLKAKSEGAHIWMCKSMANVHFAHLLEASLQPLYIFLYRDGRDVACSFKKAVVGEKHVYNIARQWKKEQDLCIALQQQLGSRVLPVCYEDLLQNPEKELRNICAFIGAEYKADCLQYYRSDEAKNTASSGAMWQNVQQKVLQGNYNKYRRELSANDIALFEAFAGDTLVKLGYALDFPDAGKHEFSPEEIETFSRINKQLKEEAKLAQKAEDKEKRRQQDDFLRHLQAKLASLSHAVAQ